MDSCRKTILSLLIGDKVCLAQNSGDILEGM